MAELETKDQIVGALTENLSRAVPVLPGTAPGSKSVGLTAGEVPAAVDPTTA